MATKRVRAYCFTLNNYSYEEVLHLRTLTPETIDGARNDDGSAGGSEAEEEAESNSRVRFIVFQPEQGESGTQHIQGYVVLRHPTTLNGCKRLLSPSGPGRAHLEQARGSLEDNVQYCTK